MKALINYQFFNYAFKVICIILLTACEPISDLLTDEEAYNQNEKLIGKEGGRITLNNPNSTLNGTSVEIPEGALNTDCIISIYVDNSIRPLGNTSIEVLKLEPDGIVFNKPVILQIPVDNSEQDYSLFYFEPDSNIITQIPLINSKSDGSYISSEINHFSRYFVENKEFAFFDATLFHIGNTIKATIKFGGKDGLASIPTRIIPILSGYSNVKELIDHGTPLLGGSVIGNIKIDLLEGGWLYKKKLSSVRFAIERRGSDPTDSYVVVRMIEPVAKTCLVTKNLDSETREKFFSGMPLFVDFLTMPERGKEYYLELSWCLSDNDYGYYLNRYTSVFKVNTYDSTPWTISNMKTTDYDVNENFIYDSFEDSGNRAPNKPRVINPQFDESEIPSNTYLEWTPCDDPDGDHVTYDVWFGESETETKIAEHITATKLTSPELKPDTKYCWAVYAIDDHGYRTRSDNWYFTTGKRPIAAFTGSHRIIKAGESVQFTDQSINKPTNWLWNFGDGTESKQKDPLHIYNKAGNYAVTLTAKNSFGANSLVKTNYISVNENINHAPNLPECNYPASLSQNIATDLTLSWACNDPDGDPLKYDVYFGTQNTPLVWLSSNQTATSIIRTGLSNGTSYSWKVVAKDNYGNTTSGPTWSFTTIPSEAKYEAKYSTSVPVVDGQMSSSEWSNGNQYNITLARRDGSNVKSAILCLQHDKTWLYVGVKTYVNAGWDVYLALRFDGNNDNILNGRSTAPHIDINIEVPSPGGWSGYVRYDYLIGSNGYPVSRPTGTQSASYGNMNVMYEYKIRLADLYTSAGKTIGFYMFNLVDANPDHGYEFPVRLAATNPSKWEHINLQ